MTISFLSHWSAPHLAANVLAIGLLAALIGWREGAGAVAKVIAAALVAQLAALGMFATATEFRGASGFAYALAAYALARSAPRAPLAVCTIALAAAGHLLASAAGWVATPFLPAGVSPDLPAHIAGALAGTAVAIIMSHGPRRHPIVPHHLARQAGEMPRLGPHHQGGGGFRLFVGDGGHRLVPPDPRAAP